MKIREMTEEENEQINVEQALRKRPFTNEELEAVKKYCQLELLLKELNKQPSTHEVTVRLADTLAAVNQLWDTLNRKQKWLFDRPIIEVAKEVEYLLNLNLVLATKEDFIPIGEVSHKLLNEQSQYISRYLTKAAGTPYLGDGINWGNYKDDYHSILIHRDSVKQFADRVRQHRSNQGG